ncbi:ImmA/IrrE family metallo-endopeptidase [Sphingomonas sp.]|jgi:Zn-dependent peptidase ImmA (M78 family)/DNA-binding XRE family transcriptional regulator|uniref:helix-turn-helix domain-containing protein n=1 Tax=Sphingomonas sp. TaxID=28214 RepID=UPI002E339DAE|nr:ImmA/IrrE family metallo-endopeptidase [Sphingomonas sp.]HEX4695695.1 ImmA/IrrE family metallo-endopeptidase [Sphingomonas sp.]
MFNPKRLALARMRRRMTGKALADAAKITPDTLSRVEKGRRPPDDGTVDKLANALRYPAEFFFGEDPADIDADGVSFRSFSKMSAQEKYAAQSAGQLGVQLAAWAEHRFNIPDPDLPDLSYQNDPEKAAVEARQYWGIGERPIGNMIGFLESKGVRILSLSEDTANVNAFSFWRDGKPYIFLNNFKSAESSIFDSAHELGHLLIHCKGDLRGDRLLEREADGFAGAFLMPANDVRASVDRPVTSEIVIRAKAKWRVSAFALLHRLWRMKIIATEHQYRSLCIDLSRRGYRSAEPNGVEREISTVWKQVFSALWSEKVTKDDVARELNIPIDELEGLVANMTSTGERPLKRTLSAV